MTDNRTIPERLGCLGYFQFGGGFANAEGYLPKEGDSFCNMCTLAQQCWEIHKKRAATILPDLTKVFQEKAKELQGVELMKWWLSFAGDGKRSVPDPYMAVALANWESGLMAGLGEEIPEKLGVRLSMPLEKLS